MTPFAKPGDNTFLTEALEVIHMRSNARRFALVVAMLVGGLALFAAGFLVALEVRSVVAGPEASPGGPVPNPGHAWNSIQDHGVDGVTGDYWLGTTDLHALELRVNGTRALRLEPNATSPNVIGGYSGNSVTAGAVGAAIGGGGADADTNRVFDSFCTVAGGMRNLAGTADGDPANAADATVGGGYYNTASGQYATVGGGIVNTASGSAATIGGGYGNNASAYRATIAGGGRSDIYDFATGNRATDNYGTVGGGGNNQAGDGAGTVGDRPYATVAGGLGNVASGSYCAVAGGQSNTASGSYCAVAGGLGNVASGNYCAVGGGQSNTASGTQTTVGGGYGNNASASMATIAGGGRSNPSDPATGNRVTDDYGTVGGGGNNQAGDNAGTTSDRIYATVAGGRSNIASGSHATVGGGYGNSASASHCTVGGGNTNGVTDNYGTVSGGQHNQAGNADGDPANATDATVGGGTNNTASGWTAAVGGGYYNTASQQYATVGGGWSNTASGEAAIVAGGHSNTASGEAATVPGGYWNTAGGDYSFAAGRSATANNQGCFVWADSTVLPLTCSTDNAFIVRASGRIWFGTSSSPDLTSGFINTSTGGYLTTGGVWTDSSDRAQKENFAPVDGQDVLASLAEIPITTWNHKDEDPATRHMGPVAQDFYAAFGLGGDDRHIAALDSSGVAMAGIQGLYQLSQEQAARIQTLQQENASQQQRLGDLETRVTALEGRAGTSDAGAAGPFAGFTAGCLALGGLAVVAGLLLVQRRRAGGQR